MTNKKSIVEMLQEARALREQEKRIKEELKEKKRVVALEYAATMSEETKQQQITEAETILTTARQKAIQAKIDFKAVMKKIKEDVSTAKEILDFVNYKQKFALPKVKQYFSVDNNILTLQREGIKNITVDVSKANWQQVLKEELRKQGINGENRIADNIIYKADQLVKSNIKI